MSKRIVVKPSGFHKTAPRIVGCTAKCANCGEQTKIGDIYWGATPNNREVSECQNCGKELVIGYEGGRGVFYDEETISELKF